MAQQLALARDSAREAQQRLEAKVEERTRQLQELAEQDPLTGIANRRQLFGALNEALERARVSGERVGVFFFFFSSRRRHTRWNCDWSSDVCSSDLWVQPVRPVTGGRGVGQVPYTWRPLRPGGSGWVRLSTVSRTQRAVTGRSSARSEERRVGKECRSRGGPGH